MAEIILPPEENEETPQTPELNIDKPTENSKVITIEFEAKKTNKVSTKDTNQQLYTTDTDAWFEFKETSLEGANGTYSVVFRNRHDGSIFQRTGDVVGGVAYYKIPHQEIRHAGPWRGQLVYTLENGNTTAREFDYDVKGHMLDGKYVREIVVEDFETLMSQLRSMKESAEVELADLAQKLRSTTDTAEQNETDRQAFFDDLVEDIDELQANYQELLDTGVLQTNINTKLEALEEEYAPKLTEVTAQLAKTDGRVDNLVLEYDIDPNKDPEIIDARKSVNTGITYDLLGQRINELEAVQMLGGELIPTDYSDTPGGKVILKGDREYGFLGFVQPEEMGKLLDNPEGSQEFNGTNLATAVGIAQGTAINSNTPWMKFISNGEIIFVPMKPLRQSVSWNSIYNAGAVYGDGTIGVTPPNGRSGSKLSVDGANSSFLIEPSATNEGFLRPGAVIASVGDTIVTRGFVNEKNNGEFVISEITDTAIKVNAALFTEQKGRNSVSIYKKGDEVAQDAEVTVGKHKYKVRLLKGASQDPLNSYNDTDRDLVGLASEWNNLILPLHEKAKLGSWVYKSYAGDVEDWGIGLTDKDIIVHYTFGSGSYTWTQETSDVASFSRVARGDYGAAYGDHDFSWNAQATRGWRPVLQLNIT